MSVRASVVRSVGRSVGVCRVVARLELYANNSYYVCYTVSLLCVFVTFLVSVRCVHSSISMSLDVYLSIPHLFSMVRGPGDEPRISGKPDYDKG